MTLEGISNDEQNPQEGHIAVERSAESIVVLPEGHIAVERFFEAFCAVPNSECEKKSSHNLTSTTSEDARFYWTSNTTPNKERAKDGAKQPTSSVPELNLPVLCINSTDRNFNMFGNHFSSFKDSTVADIDSQENATAFQVMNGTLDEISTPNPTCPELHHLGHFYPLVQPSHNTLNFFGVHEHKKTPCLGLPQHVKQQTQGEPLNLQKMDGLKTLAHESNANNNQILLGLQQINHGSSKNFDFNHGRWSNDEHERFVYALSVEGRHWKRIRKCQNKIKPTN